MPQLLARRKHHPPTLSVLNKSWMVCSSWYQPKPFSEDKFQHFFVKPLRNYRLIKIRLCAKKSILPQIINFNSERINCTLCSFFLVFRSDFSLLFQMNDALCASCYLHLPSGFRIWWSFVCGVTFVHWFPNQVKVGFKFINRPALWQQHSLPRQSTQRNGCLRRSRRCSPRHQKNLPCRSVGHTNFKQECLVFLQHCDARRPAVRRDKLL